MVLMTKLVFLIFLKDFHSVMAAVTKLVNLGNN